MKRRSILEAIHIPDRGSPIISYRIPLDERIALERRYRATFEPTAEYLRGLLHRALFEEGWLETGVGRRRKAS